MRSALLIELDIGRKTTYECWYSRFLAALHDFPVSLPIGRDEHHLGTPGLVRVFNQLDHVWSTTCGKIRHGEQNWWNERKGRWAGNAPRAFESHKHIRSGSMCLWMRPEMVGPKVFSWSDPIQMRYLRKDAAVGVSVEAT